MTVSNRVCKKCKILIESIELNEKEKLVENSTTKSIKKTKEAFWICPYCGNENNLQILNE
jgi:hypothetical protein